MPMCSTTIFTTALCNLNCKYCYICKDSNEGLEIIDNDLKQDFDNLSQIQQVLNYGNNIQNTLTDICIWGGEPFLHLDRFYNQIDKWFDTFPNITSFMTSTNFTLSNEIDELSILLDKINDNYLYYLIKPEYYFLVNEIAIKADILTNSYNELMVYY